MHKFTDSLRVGKAGECLLLEYAPTLIQLGGRKSDFQCSITGELYELKSDSYDMNKTANFFIEWISNENKGSVGGPMQALEHGSKYWMYMFPKNKALFIFETAPLVEALGAIVNNLTIVSIPNKGYNTLGYKVPRELLKHLYIELELK